MGRLENPRNTNPAPLRELAARSTKEAQNLSIGGSGHHLAMRAIIPAAGLGTRLMPLTAFQPKGLVEIAGQTALQRCLGQLLDLGMVSEVVCVTGYLAKYMEAMLSACQKSPPLRFITNEEYATTNSIESVARTIPFWNQDFCIISSDVFFSTDLLRRLLMHESDAVAVDTTKSVAQIDVRVELRDGHLFHMDKELEAEKVSGEFFGLSRWTHLGGQRLAEEIYRLIDSGKADAWYEWAIRALAKRQLVDVVPAVAREWAEVDSPEDIPAAEALILSGV